MTLSLDSDSLGTTHFGSKQGKKFELVDAAPHDFSKTIDPTVQSCALQDAGH